MLRNPVRIDLDVSKLERGGFNQLEECSGHTRVRERERERETISVLEFSTVLQPKKYPEASRRLNAPGDFLV
jgi:hypothetical protein